MTRHPPPAPRGRPWFLRVACGVSLVTLLPSCGYSTHAAVPSSQRAIYIEPFVNQLPITSETTELTRFTTSLPRLEEDVTTGVITRFIFDGHLRVTQTKAAADLVLTGELVDFHRQPLRLDDQGGVEEYRLNLVTNLVLRDAREGTVVWEERGFVGDTTYFVTGSSSKTEATAVSDLITDVARRIVERTIENW